MWVVLFPRHGVVAGGVASMVGLVNFVVDVGVVGVVGVVDVVVVVGVRMYGWSRWSDGVDCS